MRCGSATPSARKHQSCTLQPCSHPSCSLLFFLPQEADQDLHALRQRDAKLQALYSRCQAELGPAFDEVYR